jgi:signal transduction histidine kinase
VPPELAELADGLSRIGERATGVFDQVREISHGIHPAILSGRGLHPALKALARRSVVPVELDLCVERWLRGIGDAGQRGQARARIGRARRTRHVGHSRAAGHPGRRDRRSRPRRGSGLTGLSERIEALGGTFDLNSPFGHGTALLIEIPI